MPTTKNPVHATDLDYELAMLGDTRTDDALDMLDHIADARDVVTELLATLTAAHKMIDAGRAPFEVRERLAVAIQDALDEVAAQTALVLG